MLPVTAIPSGGLPGWYDPKKFGAKGDGVTDDGPAFLAALTALKDTGRGGILFISPGNYVIKSPVSTAFSLAPQASCIHWQGLGSGSRISFNIGDSSGSVDALTLTGCEALTFSDIVFAGASPAGAFYDAKSIFRFNFNKQVTFSRCYFYGLKAGPNAGAHCIDFTSTALAVLDCAFRGCAANGAVGGSIIKGLNWGSLICERTDFMDHGDLNGVFMTRTGDLTPGGWVTLEATGADTAADNQGTVRIKDVRMDEGAQRGVFIVPDTAGPQINAVHISGLRVNVCSLGGSSGVFVRHTKQAVIEHSWFGYNVSAQTDAIQAAQMEHLILNNIRCQNLADRITIGSDVHTATLIDVVRNKVKDAIACPVKESFHGVESLMRMTVAQRDHPGAWMAGQQVPGSMLWVTDRPGGAGPQMWDGAVWKNIDLV